MPCRIRGPLPAALIPTLIVAVVLAVVLAGSAALVLTPGAAQAQIVTVLTSDSAVNSVSCPAAGACVAVGSYESVGGEPVGLLLNQSAGLWNKSVQAELPGGASSYPDVNLASVSCGSTGNCAAVGNYVDGGYRQQGLLINYRKGLWRQGVRVVPPPGAAANPEVTLNAVSCPAAGSCTAVGSYLNAAGNPVAFAISETSWVWGSPQTLAMPNGAQGAGGSSLAAVSCPGAGDCTTVGWYTDTSGAIQGLLATQSGGQWAGGIEAVLPNAGASQPNVTLTSVACTAPGTCAVAGDYDDAANNQEAMLLNQNDGGWTTGVQAGLPGNALGTQAATLNSVACTGLGSCTAVGQYTDSHSTFQGLVITESDGSWQTGVEATLPATAASDQDVTLDSVSCVAYETCVVAGNYFGAHPTGLVLSEISGRFKAPLTVRLPAGAGSNPYAALDSVSCVPATYCSVGGTYVDNAGNGQGALLDGNGIYWPQALKAELPGALTAALRRHQADHAATLRPRPRRRHDASGRRRRVRRHAAGRTAKSDPRAIS